MGYSIYVFEGIGLVMPIMQACDSPKNFDGVFQKAVASICLLILVNGIVNYAAFGQETTQLATQLLPSGSLLVRVMLLGYVFMV